MSVRRRRLFARLRPSGDRVDLKKSGSGLERLRSHLGSNLVTAASGTAALSLALRVCSHASDGAKEVILPAYASPALHDAIRWSDLVAVPIDFAKGIPWLDVDAVERSLSSATAAIVCVRTLGLSSGAQQIRDMLKGRSVPIVEDCAHTFPIEDEITSCADVVVLSFGRGKPFSVGRGGGLLPMSLTFSRWLGVFGSGVLDQRQRKPWMARWRTMASLGFRNMMLRPIPYGLVSRLPGFRTDRLVYGRTPALQQMDHDDLSRVPSNLDSLSERSLVKQRWYRRALAESKLPSYVDLPGVTGTPSAATLWRYPLLLRSRLERDRVLLALKSRGLGPSTLYGDAWADRNRSRQNPVPVHCYPNSMDFADRLIALPVHADVTESDIQEIVAVLEDMIGD